MLDFEFEKELLDAIEKAVDGVGIRPSWIMSFIEPVIERNCHPTQQKMQSNVRYCVCESPNFNPVSGRCEFCRKLARR